MINGGPISFTACVPEKLLIRAANKSVTDGSKISRSLCGHNQWMTITMKADVFIKEVR